MSAADPLNLAGIIVPGEKVAANSRQVVSFRDGVVVEEDGWRGQGGRGATRCVHVQRRGVTWGSSHDSSDAYCRDLGT